MDFAKVDIEVRAHSGKGAAHKVRASGKVPGILYGHKKDPQLVSLDERALMKSLDKEKRRNTVFTLTVKGASGSEQVTAMIRDAQIHPISRRLVHVDFLRIDPEEEIRVTVPLSLTGKAVGVINGGNLHQSAHSILVAAKAGAIPSKIEIDVTALDVGDALHVSDLKLPAGVRVLRDAKESLASVVAPKAEKVEAVVAAEGAPAEGAAAAPAEGAAAAPAEGAAPAAGKAAGKKEGGGEKKAK